MQTTSAPTKSPIKYLPEPVVPTPVAPVTPVEPLVPAVPVGPVEPVEGRGVDVPAAEVILGAKAVHQEHRVRATALELDPDVAAHRG